MTVRKIAAATLVAGTLDILAAIALTLWFGRQVPGMLRYVASGPFPAANEWGASGAALGLAVHFVLIAVMASAFVLATARFDHLRRHWLLWGVLYGLATWVVMNLIVVPLRFGTMPSAQSIATQLFCHIVLVGIPVAWIARR